MGNNRPTLTADGQDIEPRVASALYKFGTVAVTVRLLNKAMCWHSLNILDALPRDPKLIAVVDGLLEIMGAADAAK